MSGIQNHDDASWSDLNYDVLFLVMMQLGVIDFFAFSRVCKLWRSITLSNRNKFMASKPPMLMYISDCANNEKCFLEDFEGRKFKAILPHSCGRICVGLTCGYFIFYGRETRDFWLVNPITRHELHFPYFPYFPYDYCESRLVGILVFSPILSRWVFVMSRRFDHQILFSIAGKGTWNHLSSRSPILYIHAFKGKIYTLNCGSYSLKESYLCEMRLNPKPKLTLLGAKNVQKYFFFQMLLSSSENLYLVETFSKDSYKVHELDLGEMKWMPFEETRDEYAFFLSSLKHGAAVKPESWADQSQFKREDDPEKRSEGTFFTAKLWYFPHECLNINLLQE